MRYVIEGVFFISSLEVVGEGHNKTFKGQHTLPYFRYICCGWVGMGEQSRFIVDMDGKNH